MSLENFFLKHSVLKDKDPDEIGPNARPTNSDSEDSDCEDAGATFASASDPMSGWIEKTVPKSLQDTIQRKIKASENSGPKGVLADYKRHKREVQDKKSYDDILRKATIDRITKGYVEPNILTKQTELVYSVDNENDEDDEWNDLDDPAVQQYYEKRLQSIQASRKSEFKRVTSFEFLDIIQQAPEGKRIIVHLDDPSLRICQSINEALKQLSNSIFSHIQIVSLEARSADDSFEPEELPVFLVYESGELELKLLDVKQTIFNSKEPLISVIEQMFKKNGIQ